MSVIYVLIPIAIVFTALAIYLFFWAVKTEQFDDLEKQGMSILFDEDKQAKSKTLTSSSSKSNAEAIDKSDASLVTTQDKNNKA